MENNDIINWIIKQHQSTNHKYDGYIDYSFHLRMTVQVFNDFKHLLPENLLVREESTYHNSFINVDETFSSIELACWGHDLIEDTRVSYNDVNRILGYNAANIIYAVTNEKGKTRKERANNKYYEGIRQTPGAVFVKLCDRIANLRYGKLVGSRMVDMYTKENKDFENALGRYTDNKYLEPMFVELDNLIAS